MRITILGAGDMGSAIATPAAANGHDVRLWGTKFDDGIVATLRAGDPHPRLKHPIPPSVTVHSSTELGEALFESEVVILAVTSPAVDAILDLVRPYLSGQVVVSMAKGLIEEDTGAIRLIYERVAERTGCPIVSVGGPSKANEVGLGLPTAVIFGGTDTAATTAASEALGTHMYLVETTDDIIGVELGAALKNAYAIAVGVATGMEEQSGLPYQNFKAALIQEATAELAAITRICGGREETIYGLAGFGDLSVTVAAGRNRLLGELLGRGIDMSDALGMITHTQMTIEGYTACDLGYRLLAQRGADPADFPLLAALHRILYSGAPVFDSLWIALRFR